jgi:hypothetical protein
MRREQPADVDTPFELETARFQSKSLDRSMVLLDWETLARWSQTSDFGELTIDKIRPSEPAVYLCRAVDDEVLICLPLHHRWPNVVHTSVIARAGSVYARPVSVSPHTLPVTDLFRSAICNSLPWFSAKIDIALAFSPYLLLCPGRHR